MCNSWQGPFPEDNTAAARHLGTCPADAFSPNGYGLYNTSGNVWEWTTDRFDTAVGNDNMAIRGGSYLCHESYCNRYRVAARTGNTPESSTGHQGFRCAWSPEPPAATPTGGAATTTSSSGCCSPSRSS